MLYYEHRKQTLELQPQVSGLLINAYKFQDINLLQSLCVYDYSHMQFKKLLSENEKKKKEQKLTSFALLFSLHPYVTAKSIMSGRKSRVVARKCLKPSERSFIKAGRSVHLVTSKSLTVSSIRSSFFRTGVPDWHNNNSNDKRQCHMQKSHSDPSSHTIPAPPFSANTCEGTSTSHVRHQLDVD